jgi:hypothetical protein
VIRAIGLTLIVAFNAFIIARLFKSPGYGIMLSGPPSAERIFAYASASAILGYAAAIFLGVVIWREMPLSWWPIARGAVAGAAAGMCGWPIAVLLLSMGFGFDGQVTFGAVFACPVGGVLNVIPGALAGSVWGATELQAKWRFDE